MSRTPEKAEDSIPMLSARGASRNKSSSRKIRLKCHHNEDIRAVNITDRTPFAALLQRLQEDYGFGVILKYQDSDGDMISLATQNDLDEFLEHEMSSGSGTVNARIVVQRSSVSSPVPYVVSDSANSNQGGSHGGRSSPSVPSVPSVPSSDHHHTKKLSHSKTATLVPLARVPINTHSLSQSAMSKEECSSPLPLTPSNDRIQSNGMLGFNRRDTLSSPALPEPEELGGRRNKSLEPLRRRWRRGEVLGQGAFGKVYMGMDLTTGELMAVKVVRGDDLGSLEHEVAVMQALSHDNIVRYLGTDRSPGEPLSIFLEYVPGGSVRSLLDRFGPFEEAVIRVYTRQLLLGLAYLHSNGIAHRDIKGGNVLVSSDGTVKLADFGASKRFVALNEIGGESEHTVNNQRGQLDPQRVAAIVGGGGGKSSRNSRNSGSTVGKGKAKGTPLWMAPEVVKENPLTQLGWQKADVWSFGCTVVEMATAKSPWAQYDNPVTALFYIACSEEIPLLPPRGLSTAGMDMLMLCFTREPTSRPDCVNLIQHVFIAKDQSEDEEPSSASGEHHHWQQHHLSPPTHNAHDSKTYQSPPRRNSTSKATSDQSEDQSSVGNKAENKNHSLNSQHSSDSSPFAAFRYRPPAQTATSTVAPLTEQADLNVKQPRVWDAYRDHKKNATLLRNDPLKNMPSAGLKKAGQTASIQKSTHSPSTHEPPHTRSPTGSGGGSGGIHWPLDESFDANYVGRGKLAVKSGLASHSAPSSANPSAISSANASPFATNESSDSEHDALNPGSSRVNWAVAPLPTPNSDVRGSQSSTGSGGGPMTLFNGFSAPPPTPEMGMFGLRRPPLGPVSTTGVTPSPLEGRPRSASEGSDSGVNKRRGTSSFEPSSAKANISPHPPQHKQTPTKTLNPLPSRRSVNRKITPTSPIEDQFHEESTSPISGGSWRNGRVQNDSDDIYISAKKSEKQRAQKARNNSEKEEMRHVTGMKDVSGGKADDQEHLNEQQFEYASPPRRRSIAKREEAAALLIKELEKKKHMQLAELETAKLHPHSQPYTSSSALGPPPGRARRSVSQPDPLITTQLDVASIESESSYSDSDYESSSSADTASHSAPASRVDTKILSDVSEASENSYSPMCSPSHVKKGDLKDSSQSSDNKSRIQSRRGGNRSRGAADNILDPLPPPLVEETQKYQDGGIQAKFDSSTVGSRLDLDSSKKKSRKKGGGFVDSEKCATRGSEGVGRLDSRDSKDNSHDNRNNTSSRNNTSTSQNTSRNTSRKSERMIDYPKGHVFGHGGAISALSLLLYPQDGRNVDNGLGTTLMMASGDREGVVKLFRAPPVESLGGAADEESEGSGWKCVATLSHNGWLPNTSSSSGGTSSSSSKQYQHQNSMARTTPSLSYDPPNAKGLVRVSSSENILAMPSQLNSKLARSSSVPVGVSASAAAQQASKQASSGFGITAMQLASTGAVISGSDNGTLYVWDLASGSIMSGAGGGSKRRGNTHVPTALFTGHEGKVSRIVLETAGPGRDCGSGGGGSGCGGSSGGDWTGKFVTCGTDHTVRLFDVRVKRPLVFKFVGHTDAVVALLLDSDKACVVSGSKDGTVRAFDLRTGKNRLEMTTHLGGVVCLAMDPSADEGRGVYMSGAKDSTVNVWARNGQGLKTLRSHKGVVTCLAMRSVEGKSTRLASGSSDGCMRIWDHHEGKCVKSFTTSQGSQNNQGGGILCSAWGPPGMILAGCGDSSVRVWSTRTGNTLATWNSSRRGHGAAVTQLLTDKNFAFTGAKDGSVRVWPLSQSDTKSESGRDSLPSSAQEPHRRDTGTGH